MKIFLMIILFLPLFLHAEYENDNSIIIDSVKYYMATDKGTYLPGDSVHMCYRITNYNSSPIILYFTSSQEFDFIVTQNSLEIWSWSWNKVFLFICWLLTINPYDSTEATYCWEMTDNYGNPISEGYYEVTGFLASYDNIPLTMNIEYLPADVDNSTMIPSEPMLSSSPNPFKSMTKISFSIPQNSGVTLTVYNLKGQKVKKLTEDRYAKGDYSVEWDGYDDSGKPVSPGVYFYKLATDGELVAVKKCIILR